MTAPLITSLEQAGEGSRGLDGYLCAELAQQPDWTAKHHAPRQPELWTDGRGGRAREWTCPRYTTSLDAALALAERVLPGWAWEIRTDLAGACVQAAPSWWLEGLAAPDEGGVAVEAKTNALALCLAILKATSQEQPNV